MFASARILRHSSRQLSTRALRHFFARARTAPQPHSCSHRSTDILRSGPGVCVHLFAGLSQLTNSRPQTRMLAVSITYPPYIPDQPANADPPLDKVYPHGMKSMSKGKGCATHTYRTAGQLTESNEGDSATLRIAPLLLPPACLIRPCRSILSCAMLCFRHHSV